jgi:hypothetical protein
MKKILFLPLLTAAAYFADAQVAATNTGTLYISNSTSILHAESDFTNTSTGLFTNNGHFYVRGNLSNNEVSMAIGSGTLYLNGSSAQGLNGTQPFRTYNFISNNAAGITLNNNLSISGAHTFTNGIITTSSTPNYLVYEAGSSYSGSGDSRHVNGWVKKFGNTDFIFPVGNGTVERTVLLSNLSSTSEFNGRYYSTTPPNNYSVQIPLRDIDDWEYWPITKVSGGTALVTLNWDYSKIYFPNWILPDIEVAGYNGSVWIANGVAGTASGNVTTTGTITSNALSSFNLFTFGSRSWILPVTLTSFTAFRNDDHSVIEWLTQKEINLSHYIVERSDNGSSFYAIGKVNARSSGNPETYQTKDHSPIQKIAYYRLRILDQDGRETLSKIVAVSGNTSNGLQLLTNPVHSRITLLATQQLRGEFNYQLTTVNGQLVQQGTINILSGAQHQIALSGQVKAGSYLLVVSNNSQTFQYKILVL